MSKSIDVSYILGIVRRRFYLFFIPFVLAAIVGTIIVMSLPAIYTADAKILVESQQIPDELVKSTVTALASERLQVIQQRVLTRDNLLSLVDKFELFKTRKDLSKSDIVDLMRERITFVPIDVDVSNRKRRNDQVALAFSIEFNYERADTVVRVVNDLVTFILDEDARTRTSRASDTTKFLQRETQRLASELALVETEISEFKLKNTDTLPEKLDFNMSLLERTERGIADAQKELVMNDEQQRLVKLEATFKNATGGVSSADAAQALSKKLAEVQLEYAVKKTSLAETHPEMKALRETIGVLEKQLQQAPAAETATPTSSNAQGVEAQLYNEKLLSLGHTRKIAADQLDKLQKDAEKLRSIVVKTPETGSALAVLERRQSGLQKSLDDMSARFNQAQLGERLEDDQQAERLQVIEQPVLPTSPSKPKRVPLLAAVMALSLAMGAGASGGAEFLDNTIRRSADIERQLKQRPLVVIPYIRTNSENQRSRLRLFGILAAWFVAIGMVLAGVHMLLRPLDEIFFRIMSLLGWQG
jgi:polysaccharide biosynthesis transport protein